MHHVNNKQQGRLLHFIVCKTIYNHICHYTWRAVPLSTSLYLCKYINGNTITKISNMAILLIFDTHASLAAEDAFAKLSKVYRICLNWYQLDRVPFKIVRLDPDI